MADGISTSQEIIEQRSPTSFGRNKPRTRRSIIRSYREEQKKIYYDSKTELRNDRWFQERLDRAIQSAARTKKKFFVLFMDIDHFKKYNSRFSHQGADQVLKMFKRIGTRPDEDIARFGGEEFAQVLNDDISEEEAVRVAARNMQFIEEQSREVLSSLPVVDQNTEPLNDVSMSVGLIGFEPKMTREQIMARASEALLDAKGAGRNRIALAKMDGSYSYFDSQANPIKDSIKPAEQGNN